MQAPELQSALHYNPENSGEFFAGLSALSKYILEHGATDRYALEAIIRLRDLVEQRRVHNAATRDLIFSFCREAGLFPYLEPAELDWRDKVTYEFFRGPPGLDYVFHREQWQAFQQLVNGRSVVLSAPTSFGKSVLIHAFIAYRKPKCAVIVVPTIALLDQFRRRLSDTFGEEYSIITRNDQTPDPSRKRIYVLTQERLLDRDDIEEIDILAIDEYYKLDSGRDRQGEGGRATLLNVALRKYLQIARQFFFLGPTIAGVAIRDDLRDRFIEVNSDVSTVAVDFHDHSNTSHPYNTIASLIRKYDSDKSLIFSKSPPASRNLAQYLSQRSPLACHKTVKEFADWLAEYYHPEWTLVSTLRSGFGLHHGSIPRSVAQTLVRHFNEGHLNALICTSTLIEGVNTAAKNVFIFDKKISNSDYDYFDFRNIAGRSGRMGQYFIGRIFLFHEPPAPVAFELDIPALGEDSKLSDAILVNLPDESLSDDLRRRRAAIFDRSPLPEDLVKMFAPYGFGAVEKASSFVRNSLEAGDQSIIWRGRVGYKELLSVFAIAWEFLRFNKGRLSAKEAAFYANRLRNAQSLRPFFDGLVDGISGAERSEKIERGFRALNAFDYAIPKMLLDMESLVNYHCQQLAISLVDYSYMAQALDNLFNHHWVKALDEYGIPIPLGRKLEFVVRDSESLEDAIDVLKAYYRSDVGSLRLTDLEIGLIDWALQ